MDIVPLGHRLAVKAVRVPNQTNEVRAAASSATMGRSLRIGKAAQLTRVGISLRAILQSRKLLLEVSTRSQSA
jgi:hypothetical protein